MNLAQATAAKPKAFAIAIFALSLAFVFVVALNIMVARQVIGFFYLTFVPGFVILRILKIEKLDTIETVCLSLGLSIAFVMIMGVLTNEMNRLMGFAQPLSLVPVTVILVVATLLLSSFVYVRSIDSDFRLPSLKIIKSIPLIAVAFSVPILAILGVLSASVSLGNNSLLLVMVVVISFLMVVAVSNKIVPVSLYPLLLILIAIGLLFSSSLFANHINGFDVQHEYRAMKSTVSIAYWIPNVYDKFQSLLSVTVLPTIYWEILNIDGIWISKIAYPLIFAFMPLVLYSLYRIWSGEKIAFFAVFFFMANAVFFNEILALGRQMIAELFYVLLFFTLFNKKMNKMNRTVCFALFAFALVSSHYAVSYLFLFVTFLALLMVFLSKRSLTVGTTHIKIGFIMLFFAISFAWYIYIASAATFNEMVSIGDFVYRNTLTEFFNPESRGSTVLLGVGASTPPSFLHFAGRAFAYITEGLIVIGFITLLINRKKKTFDNEYLAILSLNMVLLAMAIILPGFAANLGMGRFYHIVLLLSAPLCILGGEVLLRFLSRSKKEIIVSSLFLVVLIPFFLFQSGLVYEVAKVESWSIPLSGYRFDAGKYLDDGLIENQDISGIGWLSKHDVGESSKIYADAVTGSILVRGGYGMVPPAGAENIISNTTEIASNGVVYLRYFNTIYGIMGTGWNTAEYINSTLDNMNKIYSNHGCEVYKRALD